MHGKRPASRSSWTHSPIALIPRPALIVGPHDLKDRFAYWPRRIARAGRVLAPGSPTDVVQVIDVRDLASWIMTAVTSGLGGIYNIAADPVPIGQVLAVCRTVTGSDATLHWVPKSQLLAAGLTAATAAPLWITTTIAQTSDITKAQAAGLHTRPLSSTLLDILQIDSARGGPPSDQERPTTEHENSLLPQARSVAACFDLDGVLVDSESPKWPHGTRPSPRSCTRQPS